MRARIVPMPCHADHLIGFGAPVGKFIQYSGNPIHLGLAELEVAPLRTLAQLLGHVFSMGGAFISFSAFIYGVLPWKARQDSVDTSSGERRSNLRRSEPRPTVSN